MILIMPPSCSPRLIGFSHAVSLLSQLTRFHMLPSTLPSPITYLPFEDLESSEVRGMEGGQAILLLDHVAEFHKQLSF